MTAFTVELHCVRPKSRLRSALKADRRRAISHRHGIEIMCNDSVLNFSRRGCYISRKIMQDALLLNTCNPSLRSVVHCAIPIVSRKRLSYTLCQQACPSAYLFRTGAVLRVLGHAVHEQLPQLLGPARWQRPPVALSNLPGAGSACGGVQATLLG